ncbi:polyketide synthase type I [Streptacidiphilus pinicola]|uniref:Polyketide synthase type I n=1 Tax=Streptacidiphilus pinicola TaxID=2219663 RepID=A0A2X0IKG8_9ACTN|nr:type I polyketide synthase [Streptacidiphilus pinicola]RAG85117.1 polyketide synthase type I [Streptacidiphilus pinicola]
MTVRADGHDSVAVIGFAGRFPQADSVPRLWDALLQGRELITHYDRDQLAALGAPEAVLGDEQFVGAFGALDDIESFDADLFGYSRREAELTDPQQRLLLECAWHALDDAGYGGFHGDCAVFASTSVSGYLLRHVLGNAAEWAGADQLQLVLGNEKDHASTRIAYKLDLTGPALTVQTACSSSLVAVHLATQSILNGECDLALAGAATVQLPEVPGYQFSKHGIFSPDGHCRPFDESAHGTVPANGVAMVVLKRTDRAIADGDTVHAVIRGSALNNDGARKMGYSAPSHDGQVAVISAALRAADVDPATIGYVEAHGTGTEVGDVIELAALTEAYRRHTDASGYCKIGSLKGNAGHLDAAAGVSSLIKTVLAVREGVIPASINCDVPHPGFDWANSPFTVNTESSPWEAATGPRRAAVSGFGMGGTNVHVIVEQAPESASRPEPRAAGGPRLVPVSGHTQEAVEALSADLAGRLEEGTVDAGDMAHTLAHGRRTLRWRSAVTGSTSAEIAERLRGSRPRLVPKKAALTMLFPGQGQHYPGMAANLYEAFDTFREVFDECTKAADPLAGPTLRETLLGTADPGVAEAAMASTRFAQPALFIVEYALARQLRSWGVHPRYLVGHSIGEFAAACLAEVMSPQDAVALVCARGRLMDATTRAGMLAVRTSEAACEALLPPTLTIAAVNGPSAVVVAGADDDLDSFAADLARQGITTRRLSVERAFHSPFMDPVLDEFREIAEGFRYRKPRLRVISTLTGAPVREYSADYWVRQLRQRVRFAEAAAHAVAAQNPVLLEVGPGAALTGAVQSFATDARPSAVLTMPQPGRQHEAPTALLEAAGVLWESGVDLDLGALGAAPGRRVPLPAYPFSRERHWLDARPSVPQPAVPEPTRAADEGPKAPAPQADRHEPDVLGRVVQIWQRLLGAGDLGPDSDFFELGGDSLTAVRLLAALNRDLGVTLDLTDVLEERTIARQATAIRQLLDSPSARTEDH